MLSQIPLREYGLVVCAAALITYLITGIVRVAARKFGAVTAIRDRDVHQLPTPRMGGVAVYIGVATAFGVAYQLPELQQAFGSNREILGVLVAGGVICLVGVLDDRFDLDSLTKLAAQILAAGMLVFFGVQWTQVWLPLGGSSNGGFGTNVILDQTQGLLVTVMITVILTNAMNFIDGLDGLLAGVTMISTAGTFVFSVFLYERSLNPEATQAPLIAAALFGACLGFLPHNFYPARIFMGDSGSMFIGLAVSAAVISASGKLDATTFGPRSTIALLAPLIVMLAVVLIPLLDFGMAVVRRARKGKHPFTADKQHLHHRMLNIGHTHRQAVLVFYLWAAVLAGSAVSLAFLSWQVALVPTVIGLVVAGVASAWPRVRARRLSVQRSRATAEAPAVGNGGGVGTGGVGRA